MQIKSFLELRMYFKVIGDFKNINLKSTPSFPTKIKAIQS